MAPIISFHYEMKLSWKRMRKFHTLEIRFCKVLCPHPWVRAHQTPPPATPLYFFFPFVPARFLSFDRHRQKSAMNSKLNSKEAFLESNCHISCANLYFFHSSNTGDVFIYIFLLKTDYILSSETFFMFN